jgi:hypothetical protein
MTAAFGRITYGVRAVSALVVTSPGVTDKIAQGSAP